MTPAERARWDGVSQPLLRPNDVARQLAVSRAWVYEAARAGRIPSVRIGGADGPLRFIPEEIDRWLREARASWLPGPVAGVTQLREPNQPGARRSPRSAGDRRTAQRDQQSLL